MTLKLKIFKTHNDIILPSFATEQAACFDIAAQFVNKITYTGYNSNNCKFEKEISNDQITLMPGDRVMIPTGLIFDIPEGYSIRIHPRSGLSFKQGLVLANLEAVIDSDYFDETFVLLTNTSANKIRVSNGDRIAQAELMRREEYSIVETKTAPKRRTSRKGGLGSTGVSKNAA